MNKIRQMLAPKIDLISDFRLAANLGCACMAIVFIMPLIINHLVQGRVVVGIASLGVFFILGLNAISILRGKFYPVLIFSLLVPTVCIAIYLIIEKQQMIGILWSYPAVISFYFMLTERQALLTNTVILMIVLPLGWFVLESHIALRVAMTLILVSIFSALFIRLISYQQNKLVEAKERAESANRSKSEFLANMSHELRTPLNAIIGFSERLKRDTGISNEQLKNIETIGRSGEHLLSLINDVLEFSKIEAGRVVLNRENFDLHQLLLGLEEMFRLRAKQKGLFLNLIFKNDVPQYVSTDQNKLRQVLINLLGNAIKFTKTGGIIVNVIPKTSKELNQIEECILRFEVIDTGVGISQVEQEKIFDSFFQTDKQSSSQQGTGLGLPISRKFVKLMGGDIKVNSELGQKTVFSFEIPVQVADAADTEFFKAKRIVTNLASGQPVSRLLVVEDDENSRKLLVTLLQSVGFDVKTAVNGQDAVAVWEKWQPHLIWMDMRMPVMDGYQATSIIKSKMRKASSKIDTKIIALTASAFEEDRHNVIAHGCNDFVRKPFKEYEIFEMIKKHLGVRYIYEKRVESLKPGDISNNMTSESLAASINDLPKELIAKLKEGTELSDVALIDRIIEDIRIENTLLAETLSGLAENYAYDAILALIKRSS